MFLSLSVKIVCFFDLEIVFLTLKMTLSHQNNTRNGFHMVLHMFLASFVEKSYLTLKYLAAILFLPLKNSAQGRQSGTRLIPAQDIP